MRMLNAGSNGTQMEEKKYLLSSSFLFRKLIRLAISSVLRAQRHAHTTCTSSIDGGRLRWTRSSIFIFVLHFISDCGLRSVLFAIFFVRIHSARRLQTILLAIFATDKITHRHPPIHKHTCSLWLARRKRFVMNGTVTFSQLKQYQLQHTNPTMNTGQ